MFYICMFNMYKYVYIYIYICELIAFGGAYHFPGFCGNQHIRDHFMHASSFHCAFMSFHVPFIGIHFHSCSFHIPFIFIPMCIHVLSYSFHLHAFSFHFAFMSFHFLSKVMERPYGLAREPSATNGYR